MNLVRIEPGKFLMGSPLTEAGRGADEVQREVEIGAGYAMGVYPVTQAQYRQVMGTNPSRFSHNGAGKDKVTGLTTDDFPVEGVGLCTTPTDYASISYRSHRPETGRCVSPQGRRA